MIGLATTAHAGDRAACDATIQNGMDKAAAITSQLIAGGMPADMTPRLMVAQDYATHHAGGRTLIDWKPCDGVTVDSLTLSAQDQAIVTRAEAQLAAQATPLPIYDVEANCRAFATNSLSS